MKKIVHYLCRLGWVLAVPLLSGCVGGGGSGGSGYLGSLFIDNYSGGGGATQELLTQGANLFSQAPSVGTEEALAQIHNPEPVTFLLLGGGLVAMRCLRKKNER